MDELLLQKWVDGELSKDQVRNLLHDLTQSDLSNLAGQSLPLNQTETAWKRVAVAFIENQIVEREFTDLDSKFNTIGANDPDTQNHEDDNQELNPLTRTNTSLKAGLGWSALALAASSLLYFSLIGQPLAEPNQSEIATTVVGQDSPVSETNGADQLPNFDRRTLLTLAPDHHLQSTQLPASHSSKVSQQVPLYDAKRFDRRQLGGLRNRDGAARRAWVDQVMPTSGVTDQMVADYEKAGLMVNQNIEFLSGRLDDGRSYMIPYRTVRFSPGQ